MKKKANVLGTHKVGSISLLRYCSRMLVSTAALSNTPLTSCPANQKSRVQIFTFNITLIFLLNHQEKPHNIQRLL